MDRYLNGVISFINLSQMTIIGFGALSYLV